MSTIWYCNTTGNDTTGNGTSGTPYLTINKCITVATAGDEIRIGKTADATTITGANCTWTLNSPAVTTSASLTASISIGDLIGRPTAAGNGSHETYYRVIGINTTTITLESRYYGTTGTDTNAVKKVVPSNAYSPASGTPIIQCNKELTISGGWNLSTITQDGETWIRHLGASTTSSNLGLNATALVSISKINIYDCYYNFVFTNGSAYSAMDNCSSISSYYHNVYTIGTGTNITFTDILSNSCRITNQYGAIILQSGSNTFLGACRVISGNLTSNTGLLIYNTSVTNEINLTTQTLFADCCVKCVAIQSSSNQKISGGTYSYGSTVGIEITGTPNTVSNATFLNCGSYAVNSAADNITFDSITVTNTTTYSVFINGNNNVVLNSNLSGGNTGIFYDTVQNSLYIANTSISNMTAYGVFNTQSRGLLIENCSFVNNGIDVYGDNYASEIFCYGCSHTNPTTFAYSKMINTGTIYISNCSIDAPSITKTLNNISGINYFLPNYSVQNSFNGVYGLYYSHGFVGRDTAILSPNGAYTTKLQYNTTVSASKTHYKVASFYANASTAHTINYVLRADGNWIGTLIPVIKLNGVTIKTGTSITSISNGSWDSYSLSVTTGEVTADGELSLEFNINSNNIAVNVGDIEVV